MNLERNMMHMNACYSFLQKFIPILMMTEYLRLINQTQHFVMIVVTLQIMMVSVLTGLYIQRIQAIFKQLVECYIS